MTPRKPITALITLLIFSTAIAGCLGDSEEKAEIDNTKRTKYTIAFDIKDDYTDEPETNPQALADFLSSKTGKDVELYPVTSEGAIIEALRFGHADIAFMDGGAAWVAWQQYNLDAMLADQKGDARTYYEAHAWVLKGTDVANAALDDDSSTDPFALLQGKTSCHTGWLKSAGMLLPMGYMISNGYATIPTGAADDVEVLKDVIYQYFSNDASIPDKGTPYYGYNGAVKCLSEGVGHVAFAKDSTIESYCGNEDTSQNEEWCLAESEYVKLPAFGKAPSHPVMYNPQKLNSQEVAELQDAFLSMGYEMWVEDHSHGGADPVTGCYNIQTHQVDETSDKALCGGQILLNILNTPGITKVTAESHLGSYSSLISAIPGISSYYDGKYEIVEDDLGDKKFVIAFDVKEDYTDSPETNPQALADKISAETGLTVELYPVTSEGAVIEALRFGHADVAFMDGGAAWVAWKQYGLQAFAADQKDDARTYYEAHAWVLNGTDIANATLDDDPSTDPFALLQGKTSCHTGWLKSAGMLLPMGYLISEGYTEIVGDVDDIESLRTTIETHFSESSSIPDKGTPYYGYNGAVKCLSEGVGHVAFAKDSTIESYCGNEDTSQNEEWCLAESEYVKLPAFGKAPSHPIMYNPSKLSDEHLNELLTAFLSMNNEMWVENHSHGGADPVTGCYNIQTHQVDETSDKALCGDQILQNVLNTPGLVQVNSEDHLGSYSSLISSLPGIKDYFTEKYDV